MPIRQYTVRADCVAKDCDDCPVKRDSRGAPFAPRCWDAVRHDARPVATAAEMDADNEAARIVLAEG